MDTFHRTWQGRELLLFITWNLTQLYAQKVRLCQLVVFTLVKNNLCGHLRIEIPYPALFPLRIPHANPIKTRNPSPAHICNSRFPPLFSAQIPNITAKKSQIPHPAKPIGDPPKNGGFRASSALLLLEVPFQMQLTTADQPLIKSFSLLCRE